MARITASVYTSHVPAIGAAIDHAKTGEPYWQPLFKGYDFSKQWLKEQRPDVVFLVYNDHATAFSLELIPTFAIGTAADFQPADEGYGARPVPKVIGHPELASPNLNDHARAMIRHRVLAFAIVPALSMATAFASTHLALYVYLLFVVAHFIPGRIDEHIAGRNERLSA